MQIHGVILAGGQGSRMGGADKALLQLAGQPLIAHAIARLGPQVAALCISANGDPDRFAPFGVPVVADEQPGFPGPLAGILAGLDHAAAAGAGYLVSVAVDTPFLPGDLVPQLLRAAELAGLPIALATSGTGLHPTFGLWPVRLTDALRHDLMAGQRRVAGWAEAQGCAYASFPGADPDPFFNINTSADLVTARGWAEARI